MQKAFDMTSVRLTLRQGIAKGYWTMDQLDQPSPGWAENAKRFRRHHPNYQQHEYRNPLRDAFLCDGQRCEYAWRVLSALPDDVRPAEPVLEVEGPTVW